MFQKKLRGLITGNLLYTVILLSAVIMAAGLEDKQDYA